MTNAEAVNWLINITADIGKAEHSDLWHYEQALSEIREMLEDAQPQLEICPIYGGMCGYPSNLCYECPRHEGAKEQPQWWTEGLQPFAQPQRMNGKWVQISPAKIYECSICGKNVMTEDIDAYDFCHGCGADMRGEQDG